MHIELSCNACNKTFCIPFGTKEFELKKCPCCGSVISYSDNERLYTITEKIHLNADKLCGVTIAGIYTENSEKELSAKDTGNVFYTDISDLTALYQHGTPETKEQITSMVDTLYLLVHHDAKNGEVKKLDETRKRLRTLFTEKIEANHAQMKKVLFETQEETGNA